VTVICDNMAATVMSQGKIDAVIVGTDRVAANGDVANKIGTYNVAIIAHEHGIPFYVAAPWSTVDMATATGDAIPIEERGEEEMLFAEGFNARGKRACVRIAPVGVKCLNPAFDVTPAKYITKIITDRGIFKPSQIASAMKGRP
jgi:methylthioribose-1-phosphate isomerase